jgi:predicted NUDIX family NTP pyrophosphohydrolase
LEFCLGKRSVPKKSAGLLLYRNVSESLEVFLVHPGGPFWAKKDDSSWSIPKGEIGEGEDPLEAAKREFHEETGFAVEGKFEALEPVRLVGGKTVYGWSIEGDVDASAIRSNTFSMEWPPRSGKMQEFPEVDRGGWFDLAGARKKIVKGQIPLLEEFEERRKDKGLTRGKR